MQVQANVMATMTTGGSMETVSGRIPAELYQWFAALRVEGAITNSDKLRVLLAQMKRQHEGSMDYVSALGWFRDVSSPLRVALSRLERDEGMHSELLATLMEHLSALAATVVSSQPQDRASALELEEAIVRRVFAMTEALLRQAVTPQAAAFDSAVVRRHCGQSIQLAGLVN
jgi:Arc/MetJ-type ribon-helix-helix transcriptional regulator